MHYQRPISVFPSISSSYLREKSGPDGLNIFDLCCLNKSLEFVGLYIQSEMLKNRQCMGSREEIVFVQ